MDPLSIALGLAKVAPMVAGWIGGDKAEAAAAEVIGIAERVTGKSGDAALDAINADPRVAMEFQVAVMNDRHRLDELYLQDKADARAMYRVHHRQTDWISGWIMRWNLPAVLLLVVINGLAVWLLEGKPAVLATASNVMGMVIKSLLDERKEVAGFYFGSSVGSKTKDAARA